MKQFEYLIKEFSEGYSSLEAWLNEQGKNGWELVSAKYFNFSQTNMSGIYIFIRELES